MEQMGGKLILTIGQAQANFAMTMMATGCNLKRLVYFQKAGIMALLTPKGVVSPLAWPIRSPKRATQLQKKQRFVEELEFGSAKGIVRLDSLKISGYSRCPLVQPPCDIAYPGRKFPDQYS
jgi:hypothetical protein